MKKLNKIITFTLLSLGMVLGIANNSKPIYSDAKFDTQLKQKLLSNPKTQSSSFGISNTDNTKLNEDELLAKFSGRGQEGHILKDKIWFESVIMGKTTSKDDEKTTFSFVSESNAKTTRYNNRKAKAVAMEQDDILLESSGNVSVKYDGETKTISVVNLSAHTDLIGQKIKVRPIQVLTSKSKLEVKGVIWMDEATDSPYLENLLNADKDYAVVSYRISDNRTPATSYDGEEIAYSDVVLVNTPKQMSEIGENSFTLTARATSSIAYEIYVNKPDGTQETISGTNSITYKNEGFYTIFEMDGQGNTNLWYVIITPNKVNISLTIKSDQATETEITNRQNYFLNNIRNTNNAEGENKVYLYLGEDNTSKQIAKDRYTISFANYIDGKYGDIKVRYFTSQSEYTKDEPATTTYYTKEFTFTETGIYDVYYKDYGDNYLHRVIYASHKLSNITATTDYNESKDKWYLNLNKDMADFISNFSYVEILHTIETKGTGVGKSECITKLDYDTAYAEYYETSINKADPIRTFNTSTITLEDYGYYFVYAIDSYYNIVKFAFEFQYANPTVTKIVWNNEDELKAIKFGGVIEIDAKITPNVYQQDTRFEYAVSNSNVLRVDKVPVVNTEGAITGYKYNLLGVGVGTSTLTLYALDKSGNRLNESFCEGFKLTITINQPEYLSFSFTNDRYVKGNNIYIPAHEISDYTLSYDYQNNPSTLLESFGMRRNLLPKVSYKNYSSDLETYTPKSISLDFKSLYNYYCNSDSDWNYSFVTGQTAHCNFYNYTDDVLITSCYEYGENVSRNIEVSVKTSHNISSSGLEHKDTYKLFFTYDDVVIDESQSKDDINQYKLNFLKNDDLTSCDIALSDFHKKDTEYSTDEYMAVIDKFNFGGKGETSSINLMPGQSVKISQTFTGESINQFLPPISLISMNKNIVEIDEETNTLTTKNGLGTTIVYVVAKTKNTGNRYYRYYNSETKQWEIKQYDNKIISESESGKNIIASFVVSNSYLTANSENGGDNIEVIGSRKGSETTNDLNGGEKNLVMTVSSTVNNPSTVTFNESVETCVYQASQIGVGLNESGEINEYKNSSPDIFTTSITSKQLTIKATGKEGFGNYLITFTNGSKIYLELHSYNEVEEAKWNLVNSDEQGDVVGSTLTISGGVKFTCSDENMKLYLITYDSSGVAHTTILNNGESITPDLKESSAYIDYTAYLYKPVVPNGVKEYELDSTDAEKLALCSIYTARSGNISNVKSIRITTAKHIVAKNNWWIGLIVGLGAGGVAIVVIIFLIRKVKKKYKTSNF